MQVRALFSATLPEAVEELARTVLVQPLRVTVGERGAAAASVHQRLMFVGNEAGKLLALRDQLRSGQLPLPALVFVSSKGRAEALLRCQPSLSTRCFRTRVSLIQPPCKRARDADWGR